MHAGGDAAKSVPADLPLVSVILCTYNQGEYLAEAIHSVLVQTYPRVELLVIDNGSTDDSAALLRRYVGQRNVRLLAYAKNGALTARLNEAVHACTGEYVSILFGDDYYLPGKIARQVEEFASQPEDVGVVYSPSYRLEQHSGRLKRWPSLRASGRVFRAILESYGKANISPIAPMIRRSCLLAEPFDEAVRLIADSVFLFLALAYRFRYIDVPLTVMRDHGGNMGWAYRRNFEDGLIVFDHIRRHPRFPTELEPLLVAIHAAQARDLAWKIARFGDNGGTARSYLLRAVRWQPRQALHPRTAAALLLALAPRPIRTVLNNALNVLRGRRADLIYREDYDHR